MLDVRNQPGMPGSYMDETPPPDAQGPGSWSAQLAALAARLTRVRWKKSGLVVTHSRRVLARMNAIRSRVEEVPSDIIRLVPSAIWVIDNFQMMYREIKKLTFSTSGYSPIPVLRDTGWKGKPRIYAIAQKMVAVTGGYINEENITDMLRAAQESQPLTERELQAIPEMLGLCLLEHILALTGDILDAVDQKARAARFVREKLDAAQDYPDISALLEGEEARRGGIPFHSHVVYTLKGMSLPQDALARYVTRHFRDQWENMGPVELFKEESRQESLMESAIRAPVTSLRALEELSEETLFEELSAVERILRADPDGVYPRMDSASRAMYREEVEKLSIRTGLMETDIALASVRLAEARDPRLTRGGHVGAYLLGKGRRALAASLRGRSVKGKLREPFNLRGAAYFAFLAAASLGLLYALYALLDAHGARPGQAAALLVPGLPIMVGAAVKLANMLFTRAVPARILPAMDYEEGLPDEARTMVVMPVIISGKAQGIAYMDRLHKHFLANRQKNLFFALLADYADADAQHMPGDAALREALIARLDRLNAAHPSPVPRFSLLIRGRRYNPAEGRWMCWERKRGKLEEFNRLLSGEDMAKTSFAEAFTDPGLLGSVRYVITLDADSDLVLDNASRLAGIIDHPLNRAVIDPAQGRVAEGYAIIQPQVLNHIAEPGNSFFQRVYAGKSGLANYTMAISDVYQDVFKAGIFVGKGIYDVRAFHRLLGGVIPENRVLSHDLLESCYARTAFAGNAHIVETFPSSFAAYATRQHRWIRGDWQLLPWLVRPGLGGLSRWKILEDLRASLMPAFRLAFLLLCATLFPALWWAGLAVLAIPTALDLLSIGGDVLIHWMRGPRYVLLYRKLLRELGLLAARFGLELVFIPFDAYFAMDAIVRTLYRFAVSKKHFLMWETAEHADRTAENTLGGYLARMWPALPAGAALAAAASLSTMPLAGQAAYALLAAAWAASPLVAYLISLGGRKKGLPAPDGDGMLLDTARRTWRFFRDYATPQNHFLAPDNYQLGRQDPVTAKTSPTNIGLQLLSALAARDLGLETLTSALDFLEPVMDTVYRLPKWNGHLFNWYDTRTLDILSPQYVSTVDSGNFTGYLVALAGGLREMASSELVPQALLAELEALLRLSGAPAQLSGAYPSCAALEADLLLASLAVMADPRASHTREGADFLRLSGHLRAEIGALGAGDAPLMGLTPASLAEGGSPGAADLLERVAALAARADTLVRDADFSKLYHRRRKLFHIGYNAATQLHDRGCYDLIASESMLTSLLAIAKGDVPARHWQRLGRPLTIIAGLPVHVSWSGTMFEYLMNRLVLLEFPGSVFEDSSRAAVIQQMRYAKAHNIPWGVSESQYYLFDVHRNYQYKAFGVPKLRLQPVYKDRQVVSPYSTMLALEYAPAEAMANLRRLKDLGAWGEYGFYEAVDFTVPDPVTLRDYCVVRSFMAHHQGMGLTAIANYLTGGAMRRRFHDAPMVKAAHGLLEETHQSLFASPSRRGYTVTFRNREMPEEEGTGTRYVKSPNLPVPASNYLSNGSYSVLVTSDGDGFSRLGDTMLYRWRPDTHADTGLYVYVRDLGLGAFWSAAYHPTRARPDRYQAVFSLHQSEFIRQDKGISTTTLVTLFPDYNLEIRRVTLKNLSSRERRLDVTSYMETAADTFAAESSHPAFNKMFLETEYAEDRRLFIASRRGGAGRPVAMHMLQADARLLEGVEFETSRERFIGRGGSLRSPQAMRPGARLSNSDAFSGDSIMSIRAALSLRPGAEATVTFVSGLVESRDAALAAADTFSETWRVEDAAERFRQQSRIELRYLDIPGSYQRVYQNVIRQLYYPHRYYRGPSERVRRNWSGQSGLWKFGISGDDPIILLYVESPDQGGLVQDVLKIYEYMGINGVKADLVILAEGRYGYVSELNNMLTGLTSSLRIYDSVREKTGIYIIHSYELSPSETDLLYTVARVVFTGETGIHFRRQQEGRQ